MSDLVGCDACRGSGKMLALGNIKEKCPSCKGIGWVSKVTEKDEDEILQSSSTDILGDMPLKKYGRKKKVA